MFCRGYGVGYPWQAWFPARQQRHVDHWWQRRRSQKLCMYPGRGVSQVVQGAFRRRLVGPCKLSEVDGNLVFTWRFGAQILTASQHIPTFLLSFWPFWCVKISWLFRSFTARGCMMEGWGPQKPAVDVTYWETLGWSWLNRGFKMCQRSLAGDDHKLSHVDDLK